MARARRRRPMTEGELVALIDAELRNSIGYKATGDIPSQRAEALDRYMGEPYGDEQAGQSQVISRDVLDTIEWVLPALLKIFTSGDETVHFEPTGAEDEEAAKQATEYANHVFQKDNPGFLILYTLFKDALLQKNGTCKVWWEQREETDAEPFAGLPGDAFGLKLVEMTGQGFELDAEQHQVDEQGLHSGSFVRTRKTGQVCVENMPPEEFLISRGAKSIEEARACFHRRRWTASELIEAGYDKAQVDTLPGDTLELSEEAEARRRDTGDDPVGDRDNVLNQAMREIWVTEAYIRVDFDGDGVAEMRKVGVAGQRVLKREGAPENEVWEGPRPFASVTPIIMPHRWAGMSVADLVLDLQRIKTTLWRQVLNNLYLSNHPRTVVNPAVTSFEDLLTPRVGGIVRTQGDPMSAVYPLSVPFTAAASMPLLEYADTVREDRTGITRYNQGMDANSLNKTATGISQIMTAAQQRIELIARIFAETGVSDIFRIILWLLRRYPDQARRTIRLRNRWVPMNPGSWQGDFDLSISVGLGTGNRDQMLQHLMTMAGMQEKIIALQGGANGPLVTIDNVYNLGSKVAENMGFKQPELFISDPHAAAQGQGGPPPPPRPDPKAAEAEGKLALEGRKAVLQKETEIEVAKIRAAAEIAVARIKAGFDLAATEREAVINALSAAAAVPTAAPSAPVPAPAPMAGPMPNGGMA